MEENDYFFEIQGPDQAKGSLDIGLDEAAQEYAGRIIDFLKEADGYDHHNLIMVVRNNAGKAVLSVPF
jgi:hypothetical protein